MGWRELSDKPLSEPIVINISIYIAPYDITKPQWVNEIAVYHCLIWLLPLLRFSCKPVQFIKSFGYTDKYNTKRIYISLSASIVPTWYTVYPKKYAHGFCFAVLCCGYTLTDFPISIRLTSLALWQSNDCPSASKATLMNMDKYFMWMNYERLHNHNKAKHNKTVCIFLGIYCICWVVRKKEGRCRSIQSLFGRFFQLLLGRVSSEIPKGYLKKT